MQFIGVAISDTENAYKAFISGTGTDGFPHIHDDGTMTVEYEVTYQPGFIFIDDSGSRASYGSLSEADISAKIAEHLV